MAFSEPELIASIRRMAGAANPRAGALKAGVLKKGIGDDCAVLRARPGKELLVTTDFSIENVHFRRDWHPPESVGHRCLARGLSDIAAMGGKPVAAFLSLALPRKTPLSWTKDFYSGFLALGKKYGVPLAGGDTAESPTGIIADVMVLGEVTSGNAVLRSGAKPGDILYVTGTLGASARTLRGLKRSGVLGLKATGNQRHFFPDPRLDAAEKIAPSAHAMIDLSDGLSTDLNYLCAESRVGAMINQHLLPLAEGATLDDALNGGEDYELLFSASPKKKLPLEIDGVAITEIGWVTAGRQIFITDLKTAHRALEPRGWAHFANKRG